MAKQPFTRRPTYPLSDLLTGLATLYAGFYGIFSTIYGRTGEVSVKRFYLSQKLALVEVEELLEAITALKGYYAFQMPLGSSSRLAMAVSRYVQHDAPLAVLFRPPAVHGGAGVLHKSEPLN